MILVGRSYGGAVITEAGNDPSRGLSISQPLLGRRGESVAIRDPPPGAPCRRCAAPGRLSIPRQGEVQASFAADVDNEKAAFMADSRVPGAWMRSAARSASGLEDQAELVPAATTMGDPPVAQRFVSQRGFDCRRDRGQSRDLRIAADAVAALIEKPPGK